MTTEKQTDTSYCSQTPLNSHCQFLLGTNKRLPS